MTPLEEAIRDIAHLKRLVSEAELHLNKVVREEANRISEYKTGDSVRLDSEQFPGDWKVKTVIGVLQWNEVRVYGYVVEQEGNADSYVYYDHMGRLS